MGDDLEVGKAYKRIYVLASPLYIIFAFGLITYFLIMLFPLFTLPLGFLLGALPGSFSVLLWLFNVEFHILIINITTPLGLNFSPLILFKMNPALELILLAMIFGVLPPLTVIETYLMLLRRLSKDGKLLTTPAWKLPNSNQYKSYGEAKARIKQLTRKGTLREKTAIFTLGVCYIVLFLFVILLIFSLSGILPAVLLQWDVFIMLPILLAFIASYRFMWNTIQ